GRGCCRRRSLPSHQLCMEDAMARWSLGRRKRRRRWPIRDERPLQVERLEDRYLCSLYTATDLGTLGTGKLSAANGLNNANQVVGWSNIRDTTPYNPHGFVYISGTLTDLGTLGGATSEATGINGANPIVIVGTSDTTDGSHRAFSYSSGQMTDL